MEKKGAKKSLKETHSIEYRRGNEKSGDYKSRKEEITRTEKYTGEDKNMPHFSMGVKAGNYSADLSLGSGRPAQTGREMTKK